MPNLSDAADERAGFRDVAAMGTNGRIPLNPTTTKGDDMGDHITDKLKGTVKEAAGQVAGHEDLEKEGQAQQDKARKHEEAEAKETEAAAARRQAHGHAGEEKSRQD